MEYNNILYEVKEGIARITINRPKVMNALNGETKRELSHALEQAKGDDSVSVVILTGAGGKAFIAGGDISEIKASFEKGPIAAKDEFARGGQELISQVEALGKPVIAAVNGYALGGGSEITQACHLAIAADSARFSQPEINLGFNPCWGGTARLPRQVGKKKALEMILTGDMIGAEEALRIGLVNAVVPGEELMDRAEAIGKKIESKSRVAVKICIDSVQRGLEMTQAEALEHEASLLGIAATTEDAMEGVNAFLEKRKPSFKHR
jgi:enoyl-CoA hydratase